MEWIALGSSWISLFLDEKCWNGFLDWEQIQGHCPRRSCGGKWIECAMAEDFESQLAKIMGKSKQAMAFKNEFVKS